MHSAAIKRQARARPTKAAASSPSKRARVAAQTAARPKVLVSGAAGRTGKLVLKKLLEGRDGFDVRGLVRTEKSRQRLAKEVGSDVELVVGDVSDPASLKAAMSGCDKLVILTSAKPQIMKRSIVFMMLRKVIGRQPGRPTFRWIDKGSPEEVDYLGGINQVDAAKDAGLDQVVYVGSMGGTEKDNFLNTIGSPGPANILLWKRKAEEYLIKSGLNFTIIPPGGLLDKPGGKRNLIVDVDDKILKTKTRSVPRADVAAVVVACLGFDKASNVSFDLASEDEQEADVPLDMSSLLGVLNGKSCDYSIGKEAVESLVSSL